MGITIDVELKDTINYAAAMCEETVIDSLSINDCKGKKVALRIYGMPEFLYEFRDEFFVSGDRYSLGKKDLNMNQAFWRNQVIEAMDATLNFEVSDCEDRQKILASAQRNVHLSPYLQWDATKHATLVSFVQPNDPMVARVLNRAGEIANEKGMTMCGYQQDTACRQAECIYQAISEQKIHYFCPPAAGLPELGQKIRIPSMVLDEQVKQGTCIDLAVLYASCLEAAGLHALLFIVKGHAFAGLWSDNVRLNQTECTDFGFIKNNLIPEGDVVDTSDTFLCPVECTFMTDDKKVSFLNAVAAGVKNLGEDTFEYMLDVAQCRTEGYAPVFTSASAGVNPVMKKSMRKLTKLQRLQRQAMDFSMKNQLLARRQGEDCVRFTISAEDFFRQEYTGTELCLNIRDNARELGVDLTQMDRKLFALLREDIKARKDLGRGVIYLTVNAITWSPEAGKQVEAPLYLIPVEIYRNLRGELLFDCDGKNARINPVIRELLHSDYNIDISPLTDYPGKEYKEQMELLTQILGGSDQWTLTCDLFEIGIYQMPNEAIYAGLCDERLEEHPIVKGILDGKMSWDNHCETENKAEKVLYPFASDSSQRKVISSVSDRRAEVVFGPAGNGKSQTIVNLLVDQMAQGKKVLFIAEKAPAQEVIYNKLKEIDLDPFCMYLPEGAHSMDGIRSRVEDTLKAITSFKAQKADQKAIDEYYHAIEELLNYHEALRARDEEGKSLLELFGEAQKYCDIQKHIDLSGLGQKVDWTKASQIVNSLAQYVKGGMPANAYGAWRLKGLDGTEEERRQISDAVYQALKARTEASNALTNLQLALQMIFLDLSEEATREHLLQYVQLFKQCPVVGSMLPAPEEEDFRVLLNLVHVVASAPSTSQRFEEASDRLWAKIKEFDDKAKTDSPMGSADSLYSIYRLHPNRPMGLPLTQEEKKLIQQLSTYKSYEQKIVEFTEGRPEDERKQAIRIARMLGRGEDETISKRIREYDEALSKISQADRRAQELALKYPCTDAEAEELYHQWLALDGSWEEIRPYILIREKAADAHLETLLIRIEKILGEGVLTADELVPVFEKSLLDEKIHKGMNRLPLFEGTRCPDYQTYLDGLTEKENRAREALRSSIRDNIAGNMPNLSQGVENNEELGLLQKLIRHSEAKATVRQLFEKAGGVLMQMYPCMIMDPHTAAECLAYEMPRFDLVVIDEGSQLPTYKALIPISRAEKCVIVGDEKQLTPTNFFQKNFEDEDGFTMGKESILEDAIVTSMPQIMLKCHYRSKYESLVAFSNSRYYHGEIVTFPGRDAGFKGVQCIYVEDGIYDRGGSRSNRKEAERVLALLEEIYEGLPGDTTETVGVITFNMEQKELIEELIRQAVLEDVKAGKQLMELVDVVNLEACQGKEWDITILSTGYGKDKDGKFTANLGPMSREEGRNRLNVMITRARKYMYVVTSLMPGMIDESAKAGLKDVRDFLLYAAGELQLDTRSSETEQTGEDTAVSELAVRLRELGYTVHENIGSSECKVNVGVVDESGNEYQLGIMLDDYQSSFNILDYELLIPALLKARGWKLYRLFAEDWYKQPRGKIKEIEKMLKEQVC